MDAQLGSLQFVNVGGSPVPLSAGQESEGVSNKLETSGFVNGSYQPFLGSSYVQFVTLGKGTPAVRGILTYSQSTDPASPYFNNQLRTYTDKQLYTLPAPYKSRNHRLAQRSAPLHSQSSDWLFFVGLMVLRLRHRWRKILWTGSTKSTFLALPTTYQEHFSYQSQVMTFHEEGPDLSRCACTASELH